MFTCICLGLSLRGVQRFVHLYFLWGLPTSKGVCLPYSDESCHTKGNFMYYLLQVFLHLQTLLLLLLLLLSL